MNRIFVLRDAEIRNRAMQAVGELAISDPPHEIVVRPHKSARTLDQSARYWAMLTEIGEHLGYTKDEMHDVFRRMFLPHTEVTVGNVTTLSLTSTAKLDVGAMAQYMEHIERFCAEEGIPLRAYA